MPKLTKRIVDAVKPDPAAEVLVWDTELRGFGVRMMSSGVASYLVKYRNKEGRQRKLTLGRVGAVTPEEARGLARKHLAEVAHGGDPSAERSQLRKSITLGELCDLYVADVEHRVKASTLAMDRSRIERHVKPLLGDRTVVSITPQDVARLQADVIAGKTARKRVGRGGVTTGGKGAASRTIGMLGTILEFGVRRRIIKDNPARGVERTPEGKQRRFLSTEEVRKLGEAMRAALDEGEGKTGVAAVRFLLLSGCRRMEALGLRSEWVDRPARCIRFPDTKSGAQIRAIGSAAIKALDEAPAGDGWAFPSALSKAHFVGLPKVLDRLCERAELKGVTVHVLRHTFAATAAEQGFSELTIAGLLGHTVPGVTARYAHVPDRALVTAAEQVSACLAAALNPAAAKGEVVGIAEGRRSAAG